MLALALLIQPLPQLGVGTRVDAAVIIAIGIALAALGLMLPTSEVQIETRSTQLDRIFPVWQFGERHAIDVEASPTQVMNAVRTVKGGEILMFHTLTWIRRGGRRTADSILNAANIDEPIIDVALRCGFVELADSSDELLVGTAITRGDRGSPPTSALNFGAPPPGGVVAGMNFLVTPIGTNRSRLTTETRVNANGARARRLFALYWRLIYPGSALIRQTWLRAVARRATTPATH